ncbi:hypothetical protein B0H13DRAFT_2379548 [Mycena leptocephala]|nr:hypothetical protein B0H13DRAFT_2379548 [Mycena leptocephala]
MPQSNHSHRHLLPRHGQRCYCLHALPTGRLCHPSSQTSTRIGFETLRGTDGARTHSRKCRKRCRDEWLARVPDAWRRVGDDRVEGRNAASLPSDVPGVCHPQRARFFLPLAHEARKPHQPILPSHAHSRYSKREPHLGITTIPAAHGVCDSVRDPYRYGNSNDKGGNSSAAVCVQTETRHVESFRLDTIFRPSSGVRRLRASVRQRWGWEATLSNCETGAAHLGEARGASNVHNIGASLLDIIIIPTSSGASTASAQQQVHSNGTGRTRSDRGGPSCAFEEVACASDVHRLPNIGSLRFRHPGLQRCEESVRATQARKGEGSGVHLRFLQLRGPELRCRGMCVSKNLTPTTDIVTTIRYVSPRARMPVQRVECTWHALALEAYGNIFAYHIPLGGCQICSRTRRRRGSTTASPVRALLLRVSDESEGCTSIHAQLAQRSLSRVLFIAHAKPIPHRCTLSARECATLLIHHREAKATKSRELAHRAPGFLEKSDRYPLPSEVLAFESYRTYMDLGGRTSMHGKPETVRAHTRVLVLLTTPSSMRRLSPPLPTIVALHAKRMKTIRDRCSLHGPALLCPSLSALSDLHPAHVVFVTHALSRAKLLPPAWGIHIHIQYASLMLNAAR